MPSIVWGRDPQEAYEGPYEYAAQDQFAREPDAVLRQLYLGLNVDRHRYSKQDRSAAKAMWLLAMDALDSLRESLAALQRKEHRIAGKLFRDVMESMDLVAYFSEHEAKNQEALARWYDNKYVAHSEYRDRFRQLHGEPAARALAAHYHRLSRFTHRSYNAILEGYTVSGESRLVHDRTDETYGPRDNSTLMLVPPETIAAYYAALSGFILEYAEELILFDLADAERVRTAFEASLEAEAVPRRFTPRRWILQRELAKSSERTSVDTAG